eukprot:1137421-Pelagomonas_calceolata.AAC.1
MQEEDFCYMQANNTQDGHQALHGAGLAAHESHQAPHGAGHGAHISRAYRATLESMQEEDCVACWPIALRMVINGAGHERT